LDHDCIELLLSQFILNNQTIENINIRDNKITDKGIEILISNITIKYFGINGNKGITNKSISLIKYWKY